jgi:hypothetical protein
VGLCLSYCMKTRSLGICILQRQLRVGEHGVTGRRLEQMPCIRACRREEDDACT